MNDSLIRMCDLSQSDSAVTELTTDWLSRLLAQASGMRDFLPRQITRRRTGRVMRVALDGVLVITLNLVFQLSKALEELMIELTPSDKFVRLALDGLLGACEFFRECRKQRLRVASESSLKVFDLILKPSDETQDSLWSLIVKSQNSRVIKNECPQCMRNQVEQTRRVTEKGGAWVAPCYPLFGIS